MRPDTFTNTEADAAAYEALRGYDEWAGVDYGAFATVSPLCRLCQNAPRSKYVCGPCGRDVA